MAAAAAHCAQRDLPLGWPENVEELSRYAERVLVIRACGGFRPAARALGISPGSLIGWAKRYRVAV